MNVVDFPHGRAGGNRRGLSTDQRELVKDFLSIANYLDAVAARIGRPCWARARSEEMRLQARKLQDV